MKYCLIYNPVSGRGLGASTAESLERLLKQRDHDVLCLPTLADAQAFQASLSDLGEQTRVVCIGGDGTLLYFLNSGAPFKDLAFYGMGTANVISIEFSLPRKLDAFVDMLEAGKAVRVRPGVMADGTRFLMMASFGLDAYVLAMGSQQWKNRIGKLAFIFPTLRALFKYDYPKLKLTMDDGQQVEASFAVVARFRHYGGSFVMAPMAEAGADTFEVIALEKCGFLATARFMLRVALKKSPVGSGVKVFRTKSVKTEGLVPVQVDGDYHEGAVTEMHVDVASFPLIVP